MILCSVNKDSCDYPLHFIHHQGKNSAPCLGSMRGCEHMAPRGSHGMELQRKENAEETLSFSIIFHNRYSFCFLSQLQTVISLKMKHQDLPGDPLIMPASAGDMGLILVWEDPTCHGATEPLCYVYGAHMP